MYKTIQKHTAPANTKEQLTVQQQSTLYNSQHYTTVNSSTTVNIIEQLTTTTFNCTTTVNIIQQLAVQQPSTLYNS